MMRKFAIAAVSLAVARAEEAHVDDWGEHEALSLLQVRATKAEANATTTFNDGDTVRGRNMKCQGGQIVRFSWREGGKSFDDCRAECLLLPNCKFFAHWTKGETANECRLYKGKCKNTQRIAKAGERKNILYQINRAPEEPVDEEPEVDPVPPPKPETRPFVPPVDAAKAVDDPHIADARGKHFDLFKPGKHTLLAIPKGAPPSDALIHVTATVERGGPRDNDLWIRRLLIRGEWAMHTIGFKTNSAAFGSESNTLMRLDDGDWMSPDAIAMSPHAPASFVVHNGVIDHDAPKTEFAQSISKKIEMTMGPLNLDVKWGTSQKEGKGHNHIDFHVRGLSKVTDEEIGGLLGGSEGEAQSLISVIKGDEDLNLMQEAEADDMLDMEH